MTYPELPELKTIQNRAIQGNFDAIADHLKAQREHFMGASVPPTPPPAPPPAPPASGIGPNLSGLTLTPAGTQRVKADRHTFRNLDIASSPAWLLPGTDRYAGGEGIIAEGSGLEAVDVFAENCRIRSERYGCAIWAGRNWTLRHCDIYAEPKPERPTGDDYAMRGNPGGTLTTDHCRFATGPGGKAVVRIYGTEWTSEYDIIEGSRVIFGGGEQNEHQNTLPTKVTMRHGRINANGGNLYIPTNAQVELDDVDLAGVSHISVDGSLTIGPNCRNVPGGSTLTLPSPSFSVEAA